MSGNSAQQAEQLHGQIHQHTAVVTHALRQQAGIPYEVERKICSACRRILDERTVRRAAA